MSIKDGGPAFPAPYGVGHVTTQGMTLRDHFAGLAMQGLLAEGPCGAMKNVAADAYNMADAMLKAREEE